MQLRHKQNNDARRGSGVADKDEVRKSFQAAPERYRKESSYINMDRIGTNAPVISTGNSPKV